MLYEVITQEGIECIAHFAVRQVRFRHRQERLRPGLVETEDTAFAIQNGRNAQRLFRTAPGGRDISNGHTAEMAALHERRTHGRKIGIAFQLV